MSIRFSGGNANRARTKLSCFHRPEGDKLVQSDVNQTVWDYTNAVTEDSMTFFINRTVKLFSVVGFHYACKTCDTTSS